MDFGDILKQWEDGQKQNRQKKTGPQKSNKKANALTKEQRELLRQGYSLERQMEEDNSRRANPMEVWLNQHGTVDKDKINDEAERENALNDREYLKRLKPEAVIDLHGLTRDEAWSRLEAFVTDAQRRSYRKILIIHGKGNHSTGSDPVLGPMVRLFIEQDRRLGSSGHPDRNNGGNGATWVLLKR
ncbi:MAG: Smr/MutS family protein [Treponema sp.]|nr:Smr/MutS family protein [Treponema sp.]